MKSNASIILSLIILSFNQLIAQGEAALPFLYMSPSPQFNGLGLTGVSVPNNDAFGSHYNPAMLGYFGQKNNLSVQTYPGPVNWASLEQIKLNGFATSAGYNFKSELNGLNLSVGAGYLHGKISYGSFNYDSYDAYGIGVSLDYYIMLAIGITFKSIYSQLGNPALSLTDSEPVKANATDYGILLTLPVSELFDNPAFELPDRSTVTPQFNYSLGYSRLNIGDEISYTDPAQSDPLPLTARLGHTLNFGINYSSKYISINMIDYNLIIEADDILINKEPGGFSYQGMLGDLDFGKHLIQVKSDDKVVVHKGHAIRLVETVTILTGSFRGRGFSSVIKTGGLILSSSGLFKWLNSITKSRILKFLADHIELQYISSTIFDKSSMETDLSGLSVSFLNYSFN